MTENEKALADAENATRDAEWEPASDDGDHTQQTLLRVAVLQLAAHVRRLVAENERLRAALAPFAEYARKLAPETQGSFVLDPLHIWNDTTTCDDFRRAAAALEATT